MRVVFSMLLLVGFAVGAAEPTQTFTDDLNRKVVVPVHPKRIVSLHDLDITIPLIELGVPPVASHGRTRPDGSHFLRSSGMLTGVDFDNSDITFIGTADIDIEAIAAEHGIGQVKNQWLPTVRSEAEIAIMRAIKAAVDPHQIMNPGKLLP